MSALGDKLKALGVKVGAQNLPPSQAPELPRPAPASSFPLESILGGHPYPTQVGETFVVETIYSSDYRHGQESIHLTEPLDMMARWAGDAERLCRCGQESFAFLDTETTGLSGGSGTYAFLIGVGRFEGQDFRLAQFFLRDPIEEPAQLAALEAFLAPCTALVTFNGKAFDAPLINTRFVTHGWRPPLLDYSHVDLLHLARRLYRDRLPSRTLTNLEAQILGHLRSEDDVPGWMIPSLYFQYLRDGDAHPLRSVFYHNAMDVVAMAALMNHMAGLLANPLDGRVQFGVDLIALARLHEDLGDPDTATRLYLNGLERDLPDTAITEALLRLADLYKRREQYESAIPLWEKAAERKQVPAFLELAKLYEHRYRDIAEALRWTKAAINLVTAPTFSPIERRQWLPDLDHRLARLQKKWNLNYENRSNTT